MIPRTTRNGFTLLEMLVVLVIASIVILVMAVLSKATFDVLRAGESRAQLSRAATLAIEYLARDIETATAIPLMTDRDLNGVPDDDTNAGYDEDADWIIGFEVGDEYFIPSGFFLSEAWADHLKTLHASYYRVGFSGGVISEELAPPKNIRVQGLRLANYTSYFRLAIPVSEERKQPYYLSTYPINNTFLNWYPETVAVGFREETAVLTQDLALGYRPYTANAPESDALKPTPGNLNYFFYYNQPVGTNITNLRFEYFHEVPVYTADAQGRVAYRDLENGDVSFEDAPTWASGNTKEVVSRSVPIIDHFELRQVDVVDNSRTSYNIQHQYTQNFFNGAIMSDPAYQGFPWGNEADYSGWSIGYYWDEPPRNPDNPPVDHYAWTTDGQFRAVRYDTAYLTGRDNSSPTGWDAGNADGIPDGDGLPDDPVPGYWLPYLRAVRVTVVATPTSIIQKRLNLSGTERGGRTVYYNIDSPIPYADSGRTVPLTTAKDLYVGEGKDVVVTRMVYLNKTFKVEVVTDPADPRLRGARRADVNFFRGVDYAYIDPLNPDATITPITPPQKFLVKDLR